MLWKGVGGEGARRRCMKAKALQTIDTLYMTRYCSNNTAVIYCNVQVQIELYGWIKHHHHLQYPTKKSGFFFFSPPLFLLINSTEVYIYILYIP